MSVAVSTRKFTEQRVRGAQGLSRRFIDGKATNSYRYARMVNGTRIQRRFEADTVAEARDVAASLSRANPRQGRRRAG